MTIKLYDENSHLKEFSAQVISCKKGEGNYEIILDKTAFFPNAGGQESDLGFINDAKVLNVQIKNEIIIHFTDKPLEEGVEVKCSIDFERRFDFMQQHSAEHIVSGVANSLYGCENVGFHLSRDIVTLDFDKFLTAEQIEKIEMLANKAVFNNVQFKTYYPNSETLKTLTYRSKKELEGAVRIVEIENTDMCACCAPHVNFAGEIGLIKLLAPQKLRGGVRLELKAGKRALFDYKEKYENIHKISFLLCVKQNETATACQKLLDQISDLKFKLNGFKRQALFTKAEEFLPELKITTSFEEELEIKELQMYADLIYKKAGGIRAVLSKLSEDTYNFAICGESEALEKLFVDFKQSFNVRGGGRNGMVQGTVIGEKVKIEEFFSGLN